ncbi:MAG TPA: PA2169 family four-helix-bundle protein [Acidobacteriaceae bacterium]
MTSKTLTKTEETLRSVIEILIDGQKGFETIGEHLADPTLKKYFLAESLRRAQFRGDLEEVLHQEGLHDIKESGTVSGSLHRSWGELKTKLGGGDHSLLDTAEQGEDSAKKEYAKALEVEELPLPVRQMLSTQAAHIQSSHDYVKAARDRTK